MSFKSSKSQAPSSRDTSSTKEERSEPNCIWNLRFDASLDVGCWSLEFSAASRYALALLLLIFAMSSFAVEPTLAELQFFESRIRPVLAKNCYKCHSQQSEKVKGGLLLDTKEGTLKGGESGAVIVPGEPEKSLLIKAVRYTDPDLQMPPKGKKLPDADVAELVAWIKMG